MEKLSGLLLDIYDDAEGEILREVFPDRDNVPELCKQAHYLSHEEREELPSDVFALELVDGGVSLRKFACTDAGNTALSVIYFLKTGHKLPAEAQKTAAQNLMRALEWFDIPPPEPLEKVALNPITLLVAPSVIKGTKQQVQSNMANARASGAVVNPNVTKYTPLSQV